MKEHSRHSVTEKREGKGDCNARRINTSEGYEAYKKKLAEFPMPLNQWMENTAKNIRIQDLKVDNIYKELGAILPAGALINDERLRPLVFKEDNEGKIIEHRKKANKYYHIKSILGIVGQLQNSGASNNVCIEKSDYITLKKIQDNRLCGEILSMFGKI